MSLLPFPNPAHFRVRSLLFVCWLGGLVATGWAADSPLREFDISAGAAGRTLKVFAQQGGREIVFSLESIGDTQTNAVRGAFTPQEALDKMLTGTGLVAGKEEKSGVFSVRKRGADPKVPRAAQKTAGDRPGSIEATLPDANAGIGGIEGRVYNVDSGQGVATFLEHDMVIPMDDA